MEIWRFIFFLFSLLIFCCFLFTYFFNFYFFLFISALWKNLRRFQNCKNINLRKWKIWWLRLFFLFSLLTFLLFVCFSFFLLIFNFILFYLFLTSFETLQENNLTFLALYKNTNSNFFNTLQEVANISEYNS